MSKTNNKKVIILTIIICFIYAVSDEIHQHFVPGRACRLADVIIDTSGSAFFCFVYMFFSKRKNKKAS